MEIVRLPVATGQLDALLTFLDGHAYFAQPELASSRILVAEDGSEVVLVIDWTDPTASRRALGSPAGTRLIEGLRTSLREPPRTHYFRGVS